MTSQPESFPQDASAQPKFCPRRGPLFLAMRIYGHGGLVAWLTPEMARQCAL